MALLLVVFILAGLACTLASLLGVHQLDKLIGSLLALVLLIARTLGVIARHRAALTISIVLALQHEILFVLVHKLAHPLLNSLIERVYRGVILTNAVTVEALKAIHFLLLHWVEEL